jgi:signal transduction histidine kinase
MSKPAHTLPTHSARPPRPAGARWAVLLAGVGAFNALIALFLTAIGFGGSLGVNMLFSQCIGLSVFLALQLGRRDALTPAVRAAAAGASIAAGALVGTSLAMGLVILAGVEPPAGRAVPALYLQAVLIGLLFGALASYFFLSREKLAETKANLQQEQLRHLQAQKAAVEVQLKLLQAQTEPHFLFNTLAHVQALLDSRPEQAKAMLENLNGYLRQSLLHARREHSTLGAELDLLEAYLKILRVRMGERLRCEFDVPAELRALALAPMLLQPLVENAVKHGLEPKIEGGELRVRARAEGEALLIEVADSGLGFAGGGSGSGVGLANLRERLAALYGDAAALELEERTPCGVIARLRLPRSET